MSMRILYAKELMERKTTGNRRLAKKRVQCLNEALCFVSSSVLADSLVLRNRQLLVAAKRCVQGGEIQERASLTT